MNGVEEPSRAGEEGDMGGSRGGYPTPPAINDHRRFVYGAQDMPGSIDDDELLEVLALIADNDKEGVEEWLRQHPDIYLMIDFKR